MNRNQAEEFFPIIQAFAEGKIIETREKPTADNNGVTKDGWSEFNGWTEMKELEYLANVDYRIKPKSKPEFESKYRPFANREECFNEVFNHGAWLRFKNSGNISRITDIGTSVIIGGEWMSYEEALKEVEFAVNKRPFGVKKV